MKTEIIIDGQISGNSILKSAISKHGLPEIKNTRNGYILTYPTKKDAIKALSVAYQSLKADEPDYEGISYFRGSSLSYDASRAYIFDPIV